MEDLCYSEVTQRFYNPRRMVRIWDTNQICFYMSKGKTLYDEYVSDGKLIHLFSMDETKDVYKMWRDMAKEKGHE